MWTHLIFPPYFVLVFIQMKHLPVLCKLQTSQLSFCSSVHLLMLYRQQTEEHYSEALNSSWKLDCIWIKNYMLLLFKRKKDEKEKRKNPLCLSNHYITTLSSEKADIQLR